MSGRLWAVIRRARSSNGSRWCGGTHLCDDVRPTKRRAGAATMHSAWRLRSANASPASGGHGRCDLQLAVALVAGFVVGVTGLVVDLAAQGPRPPSNVRILRDGVVPPPATSGAGTQPSITCAAGSISIAPGASIQAAVNLYAGNTTFCLRAGTHSLRRSITPKTGNTLSAGPQPKVDALLAFVVQGDCRHPDGPVLELVKPWTEQVVARGR